MRITTIFGISIALTTGILIGWSVNSVAQQLTPPKFIPIPEPQPHLTLSHKAEDNTTDTQFSPTAISSTQKTSAALITSSDKVITKKDEIDRLVRLAAHHVIEDPKRARNYLNEALQLDPDNPDLYIFKASLEETLHHEQAATEDYILAVQHDPANPYRREQLADFYIRTKQYHSAMEVLQDTMTSPSLDSIWLKAAFWGRLTFPLKDSWHRQDIPEGSQKNFVAYLFALPHGIYWDQHAFNALPSHDYYTKHLQETFWLHLISLLKNGEEENALSLLEQNIFQHTSWAPELENALKSLIRYRLLNKAGHALSSISPTEDSIENPKELLEMLADLSDTEPHQIPAGIPYSLQSLLLSKEAFALPFLSEEWNEAAIQLHFVDKYPNTFPAWAATAMAKAITQNRDPKTALSFALAQNPSPPLSLLAAEIALESDENQIAFNTLKQIYTNKDKIGQKAALLLGQFLFEHKNFKDAKKALLAQPALSNNVKALEILARIALEEGNTKKANQIYLGIERQSTEAKSYLALKAYNEREWSRARQLTQELIKEYPQNATLGENLKQIIAEEKKSHL